jgi:hypothetical protein
MSVLQYRTGMSDLQKTKGSPALAGQEITCFMY